MQVHHALARLAGAFGSVSAAIVIALMLAFLLADVIVSVWLP